MIFCACTSAGETARASSSTVSSPAAAVSCGRNPIVAFLSIAIVPLSGETSPRRSANKVDLPAPLGPTNPIRSPRLSWSETSSKSARPAKDFESWETVSIAESAQCPLVRCPAQLPSREQTSLHAKIDIFIPRDKSRLGRTRRQTNVKCLDATPFFAPHSLPHSLLRATPILCFAQMIGFTKVSNSLEDARRGQATQVPD